MSSSRFPASELLVATALFVAGSLSLWLPQGPAGIAPLWPGTAIAATLLIRLPRVRWAAASAALFGACFLLQVLVAHRSFGAAALLAGIDGTQLAVSVLLFRFLFRLPYPAISINQAAIMVAVSGIAVPGFAAVLASLVLADPGGGACGPVALEWWSAQAIGTCLFGPPIILFCRTELARLARRRYLIQNILIAVVSVAGCCVAIRYLPFPFVVMGLILLVAAFRLGGFGASLLSLAVGLLITGLWLAGIRPPGVDPSPALDLPVLALLCTVLPSITVGLGSDGRRAAARELRASEERYRLVVEDQSELISRATPEGRLVFVNRAYAALEGRTPEELAGTSLYDYVPAEDRCGIEAYLQVVLASDAPLSRENRIIAGDGNLRWIEWTNRAIRDAAGSVTGFQSVGRDVTERRLAEQALRQSEQRLKLVTDNFPGLISHLDGDLRYLMANHRYADWFQVDPATLIGMTVREFQGEPVYAGIEPILNRALQGAVVTAEREIVIGNTVRHCHVTVIPQQSDTGEVVGLFAIHTDISDRRRMERELADSYERVRVTLQSIGDAVITTDPEGRVQWMNPVAEAMTGWSMSEAYTRPLTDVFRVEPSATLRSRSGRIYAIESSTSPIRNGDGQVLGTVLTCRDVTEQRRLSHELIHRAAHDSLTGLVNRAEFEVRLSRLLAGPGPQGKRHVLMYIDLDEFKVVNDACGHHAGDLLLREVGTLLQGCVHGRDTVARLGGDEFGVLLESCHIERGQAIARTICERMESYRFAHAGRRYRIGTSIGVVPVDERWPNSAAVMQAADSCCYAAKDAGRNRVHLWVESDKALQARQGEMQWVNRLEAAIDEDRFVLYAQHIEPIAGPAGGLHCEVLLRLRDDDGSLVPPGAFLPSAERFHLAARIDRWVLQRVFAHLEAAETRMDLVDTIAINLSGQSIGDHAFHRDLIRMIRAARFDVRKLCFEITETAAITKLGDAKVFIEEVRSLGVRIALDDFGAGASSFSYLRMIPVDYLKIDGQFITRLLEDPLDNAAVRCFCEVAKVVGVRTIAEFVERADVREALCGIGVDFAQGYLIHRAEPLVQLLPGLQLAASVRDRSAYSPKVTITA